MIPKLRVFIDNSDSDLLSIHDCLEELFLAAILVQELASTTFKFGRKSRLECRIDLNMSFSSTIPTRIGRFFIKVAM